MRVPFYPANILLPKTNEWSKWACIACDQFTSQMDYWDAFDSFVGDAVSARHLILPEAHLKDDNVMSQISNINQVMNEYLSHHVFQEYQNSLLYLQRTQMDGSVREGIVGVVDLEDYSYAKDSVSYIRATEGTVLERIPPRVKVRENAEIELPHVMLLIDDPECSVIERIRNEDLKEPVYDFDLFGKSGHVSGWVLNKKQQDLVLNSLTKLAEKNCPDESNALFFAVGDGNHSLATAKRCYENLKEQGADTKVLELARYALCEVVNLHSEALKFEPIHRIVRVEKPDQLLADFVSWCGDSSKDVVPQTVEYQMGVEHGVITINNPVHTLTVGSLQSFLDQYSKNHEIDIDYIHGDETVIEMGKEPHSISFLLPSMKKEDLFVSVRKDGALPRKTFSMGHAEDKRFYIEARKIR